MKVKLYIILFLFYSVNCEQGQFTVAQMLCERQTTNDLVKFLDHFDYKAPFPKEFICDESRALLNAAAIKYHRCINIDAYADSLRDPEFEGSRIRIDVAHFLRKYKKILGRIPRIVRTLYMAALGQLIITTNMDEAVLIVKVIFLISNCETEGNLEDGSETECLKMRKKIMHLTTGIFYYSI